MGEKQSAVRDDTRNAKNESCSTGARQDKLDPKIRRKFEEVRTRVTSKIRPHIEIARDSERLTQDDYQIRINTQIETQI